MDEPDWAKILKYLHNHNGEIREQAEPDGEDNVDPSHEDHEQALYDGIREKVDLERTGDEQIIETHKHLQSTGLATFEQRAEYAALKLTTKGFDVAHERELSRRNNRINYSLVFFTAILVFFQGIAVGPFDAMSRRVMVMVTFGVLIIVVARTDLLEM